MTESKRWSYIDLLECIAIYFVLVYHTTLYTFDFLNEGTFLNYFAYFFRTILSTCVPIFFFANGYLLFNRPFVLKKHICKTLRLVLLVFIWACILMPIYMLIAGEPISFSRVINSILSLDAKWGMNVFWYLGALFCVYIFFPALKALFDTNKKAFIIFTCVCIFFTIGDDLINECIKIVSVVSGHNFGSIHRPILEMFNPFRGIQGYSFALFCTGGLIHLYKDRILAVPALKRNTLSIIGMIVSCTLLFLTGVFYSNHYDPEWDVVWDGYGTIFTFINVICIFVLCLNYSGNNKFVTAVSKNTLGIYLIHFLIINPTIGFVKSVDWLCNIPANMVYAFLVLCVCTGICILFKRIPLVKKII